MMDERKQRCCVSAFALLALLLFAIHAEGKKKGAQKSSSNKGDEALCEACKALSMEIGPKASKLVKKLGKEAAVDEVMDSFCGDFNNYRTYNQIPPTMQKGCYNVLEKKHDELHAQFMSDIEGREIWDNVCKDAFCVGIPFDAERKGPSVVMDGKDEL